MSNVEPNTDVYFTLGLTGKTESDLRLQPRKGENKRGKRVSEGPLSIKRRGLKHLTTIAAVGLRHGFAVARLTQKIPLGTVKNWLGHARLKKTTIYPEVSSEEERELAKRIWIDA